jgi:hypothetical protein
MRTDTATSDIDVLVVSDDLTLEAVFTALQDAERDLGRLSVPRCIRATSFAVAVDRAIHFLSRMVERPHVMLVGTE